MTNRLCEQLTFSMFDFKISSLHQRILHKKLRRGKIRRCSGDCICQTKNQFENAQALFLLTGFSLSISPRSVLLYYLTLYGSHIVVKHCAQRRTPVNFRCLRRANTQSLREFSEFRRHGSNLELVQTFHHEFSGSSPAHNLKL